MNIRRYFIHDITHWTTQPNGYGGFEAVVQPLLRGRWEDRQEKYLNLAGEEVISRSIVYLDSSVNINDYLALGDLTATPDPQVGGVAAFLVGGFRRQPDLRGLNELWKVFL